jgi:hypothetical protein
MDQKLSEVIDKIQKLLRLSKSTNAGEAANAAAAANRLMDQYRLSEAEMSIGSNEHDPLVEDDSYVYETGKVTQWKSILVSGLAKHYGCAIFNNTDHSSGRQVSRFKLVGRKSDIQITRYMYVWLHSECQHLSNAEAKGKGRAFVGSYCAGFVSGILKQLVESRRTSEIGANSTAIVALNSRLQEATSFMYSKNKLRTVKSHSAARLNSSGFYAGQTQGSKFHLGASLGAAKPKLLGTG